MIPRAASSRSLASRAAAAITLLATSLANAQPQAVPAGAEPAFEVATVKPAAPDAIRNRVVPAGPERLVIPAMSVRWLIYTAYQEGMGTE